MTASMNARDLHVQPMRPGWQPVVPPSRARKHGRVVRSMSVAISVGLVRALLLSNGSAWWRFIEDPDPDGYNSAEWSIPVAMIHPPPR